MRIGLVDPEQPGCAAALPADHELPLLLQRSSLLATAYCRYASEEDVQQAFLRHDIDAFLLNRNQPWSAPAPATARRRALAERWIGTLFLNAGQTLFADIELRRDFGAMVQTLAKTLFAPRHQRWDDAPSYFHNVFLPDELMPAAYYARAVPEISPEAFAERWRPAFCAHPLHLLYAPRRGALTRMLDAVIAALDQQGLPLYQDQMADSAQMYRQIAAGNFDLAPRGWSEDEPDPEGFFGAFEKQAPQVQARADYEAFYQARRPWLDKSAPDRLAHYAQLLRQLEDQWLFIPICQDRSILLYWPDAEIPS